ncbi:A disintegrin and metalloproteinase with thrombospondin motifs adt-1-like isoform X3 [Linepithema humile]
MVKFKTHDRDEKNFQITGYTYFDSVCKPLLSCAIAEFRDKSEVEYPLTAIKMIGELLGLIPEQSSSNLERNITWPEYNRNEMETLWERKTCLRDQAKRMNFKKENIDNTQKKLIIELAVFFDEAAYHMYMPILDNDEDKLRDMILAYVNQIQALLHHSSFGVLVDISLVKLVIMDKQLSNLSTFDGNHTKMINSFCDYLNFLYPKDGIDSLQWDIGLYLTGINLYESEKERKHYSVVGSSFVNYSCTEILSCALVEISSTGPNAVSGFATSRAAAHEIGHL